MSQVHARNFDEPDEVIEVEKATSKSIGLGGVSLSVTFMSLGGAGRNMCVQWWGLNGAKHITLAMC